MVIFVFKKEHVVKESKWQWITAGIVFAILWASASTATKTGLISAQPLIIAVVRFGVASIIMLFITHGIQRNRLPAGKEWNQLTVYGLLNITVYLGFYVVAMTHVTAGIGALAVASNPVFISVMSVFILKKTLQLPVIAGIFICISGIICAALPLLEGSAINVQGLLILFLSMLSYSLGAIYYSTKEWKGLSLFTINGWQTLIGGLLLLPFALFYYNDSDNRFDLNFWLSVLWLAIPVSIVAVQLWLWLLQTDAVNGGLWLFLCPLFGILIAAFIVNDPISIYTTAGVILVIGGLFVSRLGSKQKPS